MSGRARLENIGTFMGTPVSQDNDLEVDFHALDIEGGYSVVREPGLEWAVWLGWHYYFQGFERRNFRFRAGGVSAPLGVAPITEDVAGQGVKLGTTVEWAVVPRAVAGHYLYAVDVDNSDLGELDSDGWAAARWRIAVDYALRRDISVGVGYEGHFIYVDQAESAIAIRSATRTPGRRYCGMASRLHRAWGWASRTPLEDGPMRTLLHRDRRQQLTVETLSTTELLALHERFLFPLALETKLRITQGARMNGWDRGWDLDGLAA